MPFTAAPLLAIGQHQPRALRSGQIIAIADAAVASVVPKAICLVRNSAPFGRVASKTAPIRGSSAVNEIQLRFRSKFIV